MRCVLIMTSRKRSWTPWRTCEDTNRALEPAQAKAPASLRNIDHQGSLKVAQIAQANDTGQIAIGDVREIENNRRAERRGGDAFRGVSGRPYRAANGGVKGSARESLGRGAGGCHARRGTTHKRRAMRPVACCRCRVRTAVVRWHAKGVETSKAGAQLSEIRFGWVQGTPEGSSGSVGLAACTGTKRSDGSSRVLC